MKELETAYVCCTKCWFLSQSEGGIGGIELMGMRDAYRHSAIVALKNSGFPKGKIGQVRKSHKKCKGEIKYIANYIREEMGEKWASLQDTTLPKTNPDSAFPETNRQDT